MTPAEAREELLDDVVFDILQRAMDALEDRMERLSKQAFGKPDPDGEVRELTYAAQWAVGEGLTRVKALAMGPLASGMASRINSEQSEEREMA